MRQGSDLFYYIFPIVISIIALTGYKKPKNGFFIMLILLFFSMFRGDYVGNDTMNYMDAKRIQYRGGNLQVDFSRDFIGENFGSSTEFIDIFLNRLIYNLELPPRLIIWVYSLITICFLYASLKKFKVNTSIALLFYVLTGMYFKSYNFARQMAALSIFLYGLSCINSEDIKSKLKFVCGTFISGLIHASAFFFLPTCFIGMVKIRKNVCVILVSLVCLFCILFTFNIMDILYRIDLEYIARYIGVYEDNGRSIKGRIFDIPIYSFYVYVLYCGIKGVKTNLWDNLFAIAVILSALFNQVDGMMARIIFYITIIMSVYFSKVLINEKYIKEKNMRILFFFYLVFTFYGLGKWAVSSLTSGYYMTF